MLAFVREINSAVPFHIISLIDAIWYISYVPSHPSCRMKACEMGRRRAHATWFENLERQAHSNVYVTKSQCSSIPSEKERSRGNC